MRPRLLIVGNYSSSWGATPTTCEALTTRLRSRGWQVIGTSGVEPRLGRLRDMTSTAWHRRHDYDLASVDVYSGPAFFWAEAVCGVLTFLGKPFVLSLHGGRLPEFATHARARVNRVANRSRVIVAQSDYLAAALPDHQGLIRLIPNPIDLVNCRFRLRDSPRPSLVWLRSFHRIYNPSLAVRVVALLAAEYPSLRLTMIGPDKGDGSLAETRSLAVELGVADRIDYVGAVPKEEVPSWLDKADIFINTSNVDNTPVSLQEAMACGLCLVSTNVGGIPNLARDGSEAILTPPDDPDSMAGAIRGLIEQPTMASAISSAARLRAQGMDWPIVLEKWECLLGSISQAHMVR